MIVRLFEMIKSSRPFQDACHIVALQLPMWQEMHKGLLCRSSQVHPTTTIVARNAQRVTEPLPANTVSFLGRPTCIAWPANYISLVSYLNKLWECFEWINTNWMSLPALVSHEILYASIESVHFTITNVARNVQGYSVSYQICSLYKYNVARNVQRVTSVWRSGLGTAKRPQLDRTETTVRSFFRSSLWYLKTKDRIKTGFL